MKKSKKILFSSIVAISLTSPLIASISTLTSCNKPEETHIQIDKTQYNLENLEQFITGENNNILELPENARYVDLQWDGTSNIKEKYKNITDIILPISLVKLKLLVKFDGLMPNLTHIWWEKLNQHVPSKDIEVLRFEVSSEGTNLSELYIPKIYDEARRTIKIIDKMRRDQYGYIIDVDLYNQKFNSLWMDWNQKEPIPHTIQLDKVDKKITVRTNNINKYIVYDNQYNELFGQYSNTPFSNTKETPIIIKAHSLDYEYSDDSSWDGYKIPFPIYRSQLGGAGNLHVKFDLDQKQFPQPEKAFFLINESFLINDGRPDFDPYLRNNIYLDFSDWKNMTKEQYIKIWTDGINRGVPPPPVGQTVQLPPNKLPRWTRTELLDKNDPHMIPPKHLAVECSNEKMCDLFQIN